MSVKMDHGFALDLISNVLRGASITSAIQGRRNLTPDEQAFAIVEAVEAAGYEIAPVKQDA